jgi:hypothetical protein
LSGEAIESVVAAKVTIPLRGNSGEFSRRGGGMFNVEVVWCGISGEPGRMQSARSTSDSLEQERESRSRSRSSSERQIGSGEAGLDDGRDWTGGWW